MRFTKSWGMILLAVFLILTGLFLLIPRLTSEHTVLLMGILALVAGILVLIDR